MALKKPTTTTKNKQNTKTLFPFFLCSYDVWFQTDHRSRDVDVMVKSQLTRDKPGHISHPLKSDRPSNHPVKPLPPTADFPYDKSGVDEPCPLVRAVSRNANSTDQFTEHTGVLGRRVKSCHVKLD